MHTSAGAVLGYLRLSSMSPASGLLSRALPPHLIQWPKLSPPPSGQGRPPHYLAPESRYPQLLWMLPQARLRR